METLTEKVTRLSRVDTQEARHEVFRIAGEQTRRAQTVAARDNCNRRATLAGAEALSCARQAKEAEASAVRFAREGKAEEAAEARKLRDRMVAQVAVMRDAAKAEHARSEKITIAIGKLAKGNRHLRRFCQAAARRVKRRHDRVTAIAVREPA